VNYKLKTQLSLKNDPRNNLSETSNFQAQIFPDISSIANATVTDQLEFADKRKLERWGYNVTKSLVCSVIPTA